MTEHQPVYRMTLASSTLALAALTLFGGPTTSAAKTSAAALPTATSGCGSGLTGLLTASVSTSTRTRLRESIFEDFVTGCCIETGDDATVDVVDTVLMNQLRGESCGGSVFP